VRLLFVYPKVIVIASVLAEEKVAKGGMVQTERLAVIFWYVKDCVQLFQHPIDSLLWYLYKDAQRQDGKRGGQGYNAPQNLPHYSVILRQFSYSIAALNRLLQNCQV
jgi:hypothetical protein